MSFRPFPKRRRVATPPLVWQRSPRCVTWWRSWRSCTSTTPGLWAGPGRRSPKRWELPGSGCTRSTTCGEAAGGDHLFPGCDASTNAVLEAARAEARGLGHNYLGTEHLLLGFMEGRDLLPAEVAGLLPDDVDIVRSALSTATGGPRPTQADLLKLVGIDLEEVRSAVQRTFGAEAVDSLGRRGVHQPWQPWRRPSRAMHLFVGWRDSRAPRVKPPWIEHAHADRRGAAAIAPAALLLGMLEVEDSLANRLLRDVHVEPGVVLEALRGEVG